MTCIVGHESKNGEEKIEIVEHGIGTGVYVVSRRIFFKIAFSTVPINQQHHFFIMEQMYLFLLFRSVPSFFFFQ